MHCAEKYISDFGGEPLFREFVPYRVSPLGAHIDHQLGIVHGFAIDRGIHLAAGNVTDGIIEVESLNFPGRVRFELNGIPERRAGDWADHLRGAALVLGRHYPLEKGFCGVLEGELPIGGLSSSAAVILVFMKALCRLNGIELTPEEYISYAREAENTYVGVSCGKLDQSCEVLCRKGKLLYLDTKDDRFERLDTPENMPEYRIAVFYSGLSRSLASSGYNARVDECRSAAAALRAYAGLPWLPFGETVLRDVPREVFEAYGNRMPEPWRKRAAHFYGEMERSVKGAEAWKRGDLEEYGRLMFESGRSSVENYECGCPELIRLYEILKGQKGVCGARFSGAGFKGCCLAFVEPSAAERIGAETGRLYAESFPALKEKFSVSFCGTESGIG